MDALLANPPLDTAARRREWDRMVATPTGVSRPVLVLAGWRAPIPSTWRLAHRLRLLTGATPEQVRPMAYPLESDFDRIVDRVVGAAARWFPDAEGKGSVEVDVVAVSMGGLVARAAAAPATSRRIGRRLRIARLFTLATPHRGARLASRVALDRAARHMRAGSAFLSRLDEAWACAEYELVCYARLGDMWVGATNTAPEGVTPIWFPQTFLSHMAIAHDTRITMDIARRLRGETPLFRPGVGPPGD